MPSWTNLNPFTPGQVLTADNVNDLRENAEIGHTICTSSTRPASPANGQMIYETDTGKLSIYTSGAWSDVSPAPPVGSMTAYAGSAAPTGWLLCDGSAVSRTTYSGLFSVLSTTYGAGNGSTTFNLPDLRGRMPVGSGTGAQNGGSGSGVISGGTALTARTIGQFGGDERLQTHTHTFSGTTGGMGHNLMRDAGGGGNVGWVGGSNMSGIGDHTHGFSGTTATHNQSAGSGQNMSPFVVMNYIIKA